MDIFFAVDMILSRAPQRATLVAKFEDVMKNDAKKHRVDVVISKNIFKVS